jgi:hypothetical protein
MFNEQQKITRLKFEQLLSKALGRSATTCNGASGFRATGIHPLDPSAIPEHAVPEIPRGKDSKLKQSATFLTSNDCLAKKLLKFLKKKIGEKQGDMFVIRN